MTIKIELVARATARCRPNCDSWAEAFKACAALGVTADDITVRKFVKAFEREKCKLQCPVPPYEEFLEQLASLCRKFDAEIGGCGCCGSPTITVGSWHANHLHVSRAGWTFDANGREGGKLLCKNDPLPLLRDVVGRGAG